VRLQTAYANGSTGTSLKVSPLRKLGFKKIFRQKTAITKAFQAIGKISEKNFEKKLKF